MGQTSGYTLNIGYKTRAVKKLVARFFADPCATLIVVSSGLTLHPPGGLARQKRCASIVCFDRAVQRVAVVARRSAQTTLFRQSEQLIR